MWSFIISTLHQIFFGNHIKRASFPGHVARVEEEGNAYIILVIKLMGKITFWRSRHRCENNSNINVKNRMG
jgi:hypothetical protein